MLFAFSFAAHAASVRKVDDTVVTGELVTIDAGQLVLSTKGTDGAEQRVRIPLQDVVEVSVDGQGGGGANIAGTSTTIAPGTLLPDGPGLAARFYLVQFWKGSNPQPPQASEGGAQPTGPTAALHFSIGEPDVVRVVKDLNHNWGQGAPDPSIQQTDNFSVLFTGKVRTKEAGNYTFLGFSDDDHYLFVNGRLVSSDPGGHTARDPRAGGKPETVKPVALAANTEYDLMYLVNENVGEATAIVRWITPASGNRAEPIPPELLRTRSGPPKGPSWVKVAEASGYSVTMTFEDAATNEVRYVVERSTTADFANPTLVAKLGINADRFTDKGLTSGATYHYRVRAENFEGQSPPAVIQFTAGSTTSAAGAPTSGPTTRPATQPTTKPAATPKGAGKQSRGGEAGVGRDSVARTFLSVLNGHFCPFSLARVPQFFRARSGGTNAPTRGHGTDRNVRATGLPPLPVALAGAVVAVRAQAVAPAIRPAATQPAAAAAAAGATTRPANRLADAEGFVRLFNGKDLTGWDGDAQYWSVRDGAIVGAWKGPNVTGANTFLVCTLGQFKDFELRFTYKVANGNSGVNYRSRRLGDGQHLLGGYQADIASDRPISGTLWDQGDFAGKRGTLGGLGQKVTWVANDSRRVERLPKTPAELAQSIKPDDWNDFVIVAQGNHLKHAINGDVTTEVIDGAPAALLGAGAIGIQIEGSSNTVIQVKDIRIKTLDGTAVAGFAAPGSPSASPAGPAQWTLKLAGGDQLTGELLGWSDKQIRLKTAALGPIEVPVSAVREAWKGNSDQVRRARASGTTAGTEDVAYVERENAEAPTGSSGQVIPVQGLALGVEGPSLGFRYREQDRKINLDRLVGVAFGGHEGEVADESFHQTFVLASGDSLSGQWTGLKDKQARLKTKWGQELSLPLDQVKSVRFKNGRLVYLSDLTPAKVEQVPYFDRIMPWRTDRSLTGGPLKLADGEYPRGLAVHSHTTLHYDINGRFDRFKAKVGFQDPEGKQGRAVIRVLGDEKVLYENQDARGDQPPVDIDVATTGVRRLTLDVDFGENEDVADRVVWAMPRLLRASAGAAAARE